MLADEPLLVTLLLHLATSVAMSCIASSLHLFFVFYSTRPQNWEHVFKMCCLFPPQLHSAVSSPPSDGGVCFVFGERRVYLGQQGEKGDVYTAPWSQHQALHTHCTLSQNTAMLEIRMAFHANRGACCAGDRLLLQKELKWKTNPNAILNIKKKNTTWQGLAALQQTEKKKRHLPRDICAHVKYTY